MGARLVLLAGLLAVTGAAGSSAAQNAQVARRRSAGRRPLHLARGDPGGAGFGLGAGRERPHPRRAPGRPPLPAELRPRARHPPGARPHSRRLLPPRRPLQFLAGRRPCPRHRPAHDARQLPHRHADLGDRARRRRAGGGRGQILGLSGHAMPAARGALLPRQPVRRRPRRQCRARIRPARAPLRRRRLRVARRQAGRDLGGCGHDPGRARLGLRAR